MGATQAIPPDQRVLVLAADDADGVALRSALSGVGVRLEFHADAAGLCAAADDGASVVVLSGEALTPAAAGLLRERVERQPRWSDLPIIVLGQTPELDGNPTGASWPGPAAGTSGPNVAVVDRPLHPIPLRSAVCAALRARRRQYELRDLLADAERGVRQRDEFLAMLGHELRNPLGVIGSAIQILNRIGSPAREEAETREMIERQASHLTRIVDDLLDVARVSSGKIALKREPVDLNEVVRQCFQNCESLAAAQRHDLTVSATADAAVVDGDPVRLEQIVSNLLTNAIKYTPAGGRIEVTVAREPQAGDGPDEAAPTHAVVRVRDNGVGIEPGMLVRVFDMFTQADRSLDRAQGGVGMGLTLVRRLAEMHGGTVTATSQGLGQGSEFELRVPLRPRTAAPEAAAPAADLRSAPPPAAEPARRAGGGASRHVLIVEDGPDARNALGRLLELWGHHVEVAEDGTRGVERAIASRPEIALIDIGLPGLNGYEVARRVRKILGDRIRLIALTGYGQPDDHERTREAGFDQHLVKPVNPKLLSRLLAEPTAAPAAGSA